MDTEPVLAVATWNVHRAVGGDGRSCAARVERAIATEIAPRGLRVLALQEADSNDPPHAALLDTGRIERETGLRSVHAAPDMRWHATSGGFLGNLLFVDPRFEITHGRIVELPGQCPRAAILVEARIDGRALRIVSGHLSLSQALRIVQLRLIGQIVARRGRMPTVLVGDLNEWRPWGGLALSRRVSGLDLRGPAVATFPVGRPVLPLDRVLSSAGAVRGAVALDGPTIRAASDHRPLFARVSLADATAA